MCRNLSKKLFITIMIIIYICIGFTASAYSEVDGIKLDGNVTPKEWKECGIDLSDVNYNNDINYVELNVKNNFNNNRICFAVKISENNLTTPKSQVLFYIDGSLISVNVYNECSVNGNYSVNSAVSKISTSAYCVELSVTGSNINRNTSVVACIVDGSNSKSHKYYINLLSGVATPVVVTTTKQTEEKKEETTSKKKSTTTKETTKSKYKSDVTSNTKSSQSSVSKKSRGVFRHVTGRSNKTVGGTYNNSKSISEGCENDDEESFEKKETQVQKSNNSKKIIFTIIAVLLVITAIAIPIISKNKKIKEENKENKEQKENKKYKKNKNSDKKVKDKKKSEKSESKEIVKIKVKTKKEKK